MIKAVIVSSTLAGSFFAWFLLLSPEVFNPWTLCAEDGNVVMYTTAYNCQRVSAGPGIITPLNLGRYTWTIATGQSGGGARTLGHSTASTGTAAQVAATASDSVGETLATSSSINSTGSIGHNGLGWRTGRNVRYWSYSGIDDTTTVRAWFGFTDRAIATQLGSDDPASGNFAMFRYSTAAGDTNWMCAVKDGSSISATSSGVAIDTSNHFFEIQEDVTSVNYKFYIDNALVCTKASNLPSASTNLRWLTGIQTLAASAVRKVFWAWVVARTDR